MKETLDAFENVTKSVLEYQQALKNKGENETEPIEAVAHNTFEAGFGDFVPGEEIIYPNKPQEKDTYIKVEAGWNKTSNSSGIYVGLIVRPENFTDTPMAQMYAFH